MLASGYLSVPPPGQAESTLLWLFHLQAELAWPELTHSLSLCLSLSLSLILCPACRPGRIESFSGYFSPRLRLNFFPARDVQDPLITGALGSLFSFSPSSHPLLLPFFSPFQLSLSPLTCRHFTCRRNTQQASALLLCLLLRREDVLA